MSAVRWAGPGLLVLGVALLIAAVATGGAQLALVVIFSVVLGGASVLFLAGIASVFVGIFLLPLAFGDVAPEAAAAFGAAPQPEGAATGGLVLLGPLPIFFGSWKNAGRRAYWLAAGVGLALLVAVITVALLWA